MNTLHWTRRAAPIPPAAQSLLKLQSAANKQSSASFSQYLAANLKSTSAPAYGVASQPTVTSQNSAGTAGSSQTPADIAAQLLAANPLPSPEAPVPLSGPIYSPEYMQQLTYNGFVSQANLQNQQSAAEFQLNVSNWALNEAQRQGIGLPSQPPPAAPQYVAVNVAGYQQWWSSLANGGDPAPVTFITPSSAGQSSTAVSANPALS